MRDALFFTKEREGLRCQLCPNLCLIGNGQTGSCNVRINENGKLIAKGYGNISAIAVDPIEKKPLYHFYPGTQILSVGGLWCNLKCSFCQNWHIAHQEGSTQFYSPEDLAAIAKNHNSIGIAFTYNEPIINYEYILDTARLAKSHNLKIVLVTNGFILPDPLDELLPLIDAMNIDVKGFTQEYYRKVCVGNLAHVKATVQTAAKHCHVELTTLVVGGLNDEIEVMEELFKWVSEIDPNIPLHLSRYFPNYQMDRPATPVSTMISLKELAGTYLNYTYLGNMPEMDNNTYCPNCNQLLISRHQYQPLATGIYHERCSKCELLIPVIL